MPPSEASEPRPDLHYRTVDMIERLSRGWTTHEIAAFHLLSYRYTVKQLELARDLTGTKTNYELIAYCIRQEIIK